MIEFLQQVAATVVGITVVLSIGAVIWHLYMRAVRDNLEGKRG